MIAPAKNKLEDKAQEKVGAVLVIGGGIAGIQAALDLAESGQKVYLLESSPAIGGNMARLDKTFPTNDCSMCILSPKLVEAGRHLNIEILPYADLEKITGRAGSFTVTINKHARFVDGNKCTGCRVCLESCPVKYEIYSQPKEKIHIDLEGEKQGKVISIIDRHRASNGNLIHLLKEINAEFNYLPENVLKFISVELDVPLSLIYRIATFYSSFSLAPRGRHIINICLGTTCYVRGADKLLGRLEKELGINTGETTADERFSLGTVRCLGCCSLAPVITVDGETYGRVREKEVLQIIEQYE